MLAIEDVKEGKKGEFEVAKEESKQTKQKLSQQEKQEIIDDIKTKTKTFEDDLILKHIKILLEREIKNSEILIRNDCKPVLLETMNNIRRYELLSEYNDRIKLIEEQKQYLKVLKEIETKINEYLEGVVKKMRDIKEFI